MQLIGSILIKGKPVPWKSHAGYGRKSFNPLWREKESYQENISRDWRKPRISTHVGLDITFWFKIPIGFSKKKRELAITAQLFPTMRPDTSNCVKFLEDCLKGIVMDDDALVVELKARKLYTLGDPFTTVSVFS